MTETTAPVMAPAMLKSIAKLAGVPSRAFDLNAIIYNIVINHPKKNDILSFLYFEQVVPGIELELEQLFKTMVDEIMLTVPNLVCLSLLHYQCQTSTKWLCYYLKKYHPDVKILIGGTGITSELATTDRSYARNLQRLGLIDNFLIGDGENAFYDYLVAEQKDTPEFTVIDDLNQLPYPNYDDYDFGIYDSAFLGILGSRGCVRQCTFCDIHEHWKKFNYRNGQNIFEEMISQNKKYGIRYFKFQDSLINGNVKEYNHLIGLLAKHNKNNPTNTLHWSSYFIFRPASQMSEAQWKLTAESGAHVLSVGIESLVDKNRHHIKKKFSNEDIEHSLAMAKKYGVKIFFIVLVGYVTETEEDHLASLQWLRDHQHYAQDPIHRLSVGGTLAILPNTWLDRNQQEIGITWINGPSSQLNGKNHLWEIKETGNNYETRIRRLNEMIALGQELGYKVHYAVIDPQKEMENMISAQMRENAYTDHI